MEKTQEESQNIQMSNKLGAGSPTLGHVVLCSMSPTGKMYRGDIVPKDEGKRWLESELGKYDDRWLENATT